MQAPCSSPSLPRCCLLSFLCFVVAVRPQPRERHRHTTLMSILMTRLCALIKVTPSTSFVCAVPAVALAKPSERPGERARLGRASFGIALEDGQGWRDRHSLPPRLRSPTLSAPLLGSRNSIGDRRPRNPRVAHESGARDPQGSAIQCKVAAVSSWRRSIRHRCVPYVTRQSGLIPFAFLCWCRSKVVRGEF